MKLKMILLLYGAKQGTQVKHFLLKKWLKGK